MLNYKKARYSDQSVSCNSSSFVSNSNKIVAVVSRIANSCVVQTVIVVIIIVSVKCELWRKSSENNKEN